MTQKKSSFYFTLARIGFALGIAFMLSQFPFDYIESLTYDARVRLRPPSSTSGFVQTISVDAPTVKALERVPNAKDHTAFVKQLLAANAKAIVYLIHPIEIVGSYEELKQFSDLARRHPEFTIAINSVAQTETDDAFRLIPPFEGLKLAAAPTTSDRNLFAKVDVTRRMLISYQGQMTLHPVVASLFNPELATERSLNGIFNVFDSNQAFIDFRPTGTYKPLSFLNVMHGQFSRNDIADKVVIIGRDLGTTAKDYIRTPFSREINAMTVLEMHANMFDTLLLNSAPTRAAEWVDLLLTSLISILTVYVVLTVTPTRGLGILVSTLIIFSAVSTLIFWAANVWIGMARPILSVFISYYFFIPYRLIIENRRSWEYFQKNRLLMQVEELKTNFLSMMSHDLRTPIARIQGMTDVVLKDPNPLSKRQKEALGTLARSSEELLEFVSSVLNLGRIESKELKLHIQSKDINTLLHEIIKKYEFMARQRGITINTEFEPLFSVKMDVDLMRQVFSNLIENAIKYSPDSSRILVSTEEDNSRLLVQIADQGTGIPEDEIGNIFMKFYRSRHAKSSTVKGSGLGLYLARYFVELHNGKITVDSAYGQGSTFTVELPMDSGSMRAAEEAK